MAGLPPKWVENLRDKPPAEQERFMQNNERFQSLPPGRQQQIRQNLQKYNNLSDQQKAALHRAEDNWQRLPPEDRKKVRD
jgi:acyl-CoA reductase-like NAD-dependent aldehyde dehydrogenase